MYTYRRCACIKDSAAWIENTIRDFVAKSPENTLYEEKHEKAFAEPIIGFSNGDDPLYQFFKEDIGDFYLTPLEIFERTFPKFQVASKELTIISWILPHTEATKSDNRKQTFYPSERWARARIFGEEINNKLRKLVVAELQKSGIVAVAPLLSPLWKPRQMSKRYGNSSTWSERHAAYVSGLGTFGLCDGLITPKGKAMRCGSAILNLKISPTERPYNDHNAYCLFYSKGTCGECIQRCPANAITEMGHDKVKCNVHLSVTWKYVTSNFGFRGYGCGLCQTNVPCESKIPSGNDLHTLRF